MGTCFNVHKFTEVVLEESVFKKLGTYFYRSNNDLLSITNKKLLPDVHRNILLARERYCWNEYFFRNLRSQGRFFLADFVYELQYGNPRHK